MKTRSHELPLYILTFYKLLCNENTGCRYRNIKERKTHSSKECHYNVISITLFETMH